MNETVENTIRQELEKAASLISGARRLMAEGRHVNLNAMEERVRIITESVHAAPQEMAQHYKEHLQALLDALDALEQDLQLHHEALESGLKTIKQREAMDAYAPKKK
jgi:uncharacterized protein YicC (UPF0701 family)